MPLSRDSRRQLAATLVARFTARHHTVLAGLYGSTARGTDTPWSDLELLFVVEDGGEAASLEAVYNGIAVGARVESVSSLEVQVVTPSHSWPMTMGVLDALHILRGDPTQVDRWLALGRAVPEQAFRDVIGRLAASHVWESCGRIFSCAERDETDDLGPAIIETIGEMQVVLCLLNRAWVHRDYFRGVTESLSFPILPEGYATLAPTLWRCREPQEAARVARPLLDAYACLLEQHALAPVDWATMPPEAWPL
jgi:kanamycin nucleotidyltransferase